MRAPLIAGNWKMNTTVEEGIALAGAVRDMAGDTRGVEVAVLPPFTHLWPVRDVLRGSAILLGAQDVFWEVAGAYTGEISPAMLVGWCDLVLVGHSERRHLLGETDGQVGRKFAAAERVGMRVIVAVGETDAERDAGDTFAVIDRQLDAAFASVEPAPDAARFVIAYEPVWAIGTGRTASPEQAEEACRHIREHVAGATRLSPADIQILYGGSVTADNAASLFAEPDVNGALVGGSSLRSHEFAAIVRAAAIGSTPVR